MDTKHEYVIRKSMDSLQELDNTLTQLQKSNDTDAVIQMAGLRMLRISIRFLLDNLKILVSL